MKIKVIIETGKDMFACFVPTSEGLSFGLHGSGKTVREAMEDFVIGYNEMSDYFSEMGQQVEPLDFEYIFDIGAFFNYYPINVTAFAKYIGINASLLRQYCSGTKSPKKETIAKIRQGIEKFLSDIGNGHLIDRPVLQYVN